MMARLLCQASTLFLFLIIPLIQAFNLGDPVSHAKGLLLPNRRDVVLSSLISTIFGTLSSTYTANAADTNVMATLNYLLVKLDGIPTFCIVDKTTGASYMLFKNDQAMAIGYAFTTFTGALAVLSEAQKTAKEKNYFDVWEDATITTVPLNIAIRLALKKRERTTPKDQTLDSLVMIIPGAVRREFCREFFTHRYRRMNVRMGLL